MSYYQLPRINYIIKSNNIKIGFGDNTEDSFINKSLALYLNNVKEEINNYILDWDDVKKITNPYEYIHTNLPHQKFAISKIKPISRSFFKMIEICKVFHIFEDYNDTCIKSYHLAEGPGGFIEAFTYLRTNIDDTYYGMSLIDLSNNKVPGWQKADLLLKRHPNIIIETGADGTGNLYHPCNLEHCIKKHKNSMDIITADGGFDFSIDFEKQEKLALRLILSQISFALAMQKHKGHFILKVFDIFLQSTTELIYLLSCFYDKVYIVKPHTSRCANSEKYIICKYFKFVDTTDISKKMLSVFYVLDKIDFTKYSITSIINVPIQYYYLLLLTEYNAIFGQQQIENIIKTMLLIEQKDYRRDYLNINKNNNIQRCIQWCSKNNMPHNKNICPKNVFLNSSIK